MLSVNVILFQGNQKNIRVGLSVRNNTDSGLFKSEFSKSTLNLAHTRFDTKFVAVKQFCFQPYAREI